MYKKRNSGTELNQAPRIMDISFTSTLMWIYYTCFFILPLAVDTLGDAAYRNDDFSSRGTSCSFPEEWRGVWFQNGLGELQIKKHGVSHIGHCVNHGGYNKYLLFKKKNLCFICLAFTPQHKNLLQYKQSFCLSTDKIEEACSQITGDFILHTMVKVSGSPIPCPFQGHYSFSYTNGSELQCDDPPSSIQACADKSRFLFNHRRCPRVPNSFEKVESFQCLAVWDNGVDHYLYGRFTGPLLTSKESQYRCFMYSLYGSHGTMSMTADATCQGLQSPDLGMNVYRLQHKSEEWPQPRCRFPQFFTSNPQWRDILGRQRYHISKREEVITVSDIEDPTFLEEGESGHQETRLRISCISELDSVEYENQKKVDMMIFATDDNCVSSYRCIRLTQRTEGVVNIQIGESMQQTEFPSCQEKIFSAAEKRLLIPMPGDGSVTSKPCPLPGLYTYKDHQTNCNGHMDVGCSKDNEIVVDAKCQENQSANILQCYESWRENSMIYLIAGQLGDIRKTADCLVYKVTPKGYQLEADPTCTHDRISFMGKSIGFDLQTPPGSCKTVTTRPPEMAKPRTQKPDNKEKTYNYDDNSKTNINDNKTSNKIINDDNKNKGNANSKGIYDTRDVGTKIVDSADVLDTHPGSGGQSSINRNINGCCIVRSYNKFLVFVFLWIIFYSWR